MQALAQIPDTALEVTSVKFWCGQVHICVPSQGCCCMASTYQLTTASSGGSSVAPSLHSADDDFSCQSCSRFPFHVFVQNLLAT